MRKVAVQISLSVPARIKKRQKWFVASCPVFDVVSQGETEEHANKNLAEALTLFFLSCHERGTLDAVLKECGFQPAYPPRTARKITSSSYIEVPIPFYINPEKAQECHA
jgi:predicted RNase H-like HicB family nuclease